MADADRSTRPRRGITDAWIPVLAVAVTVLAWLLATPISSGPDEPAHILRAASIANGQLLGVPVEDNPESPRTLVDVPAAAGSIPEPACYAFKPEVPADCATDPVASEPLPDGDVRVQTTSGRHPPFYYSLVGLPYVLGGAPLGAYLARAVSALLCAGFLAAALLIAAGARRRASVLGVLAAMTPMALYLAGVVNPNAVEATAAICLWSALLALARGSARGTTALSRSLLAAAGVSGVVMTLSRPVSALWLAAAVTVAALVARSAALRAVMRAPAAWLWAVAGAASAVASLAWYVLVGNPILPIPPPVPIPFADALRLAISRTAWLGEEMIGVFGWLDTKLPDPLPQLWAAVVAVLLGATLVAARWWRSLVLAGLAVATVLVPAVLQALQFNELGYIWQGRYTLPLAAGIPIASGVLLGDSDSRITEVVERAAPVLAALLGFIQVSAMAVALRRYMLGIDAPLTLTATPDWQPPLPAPVLLAAVAVAQAALVLWLWRRAPRHRASTEPTEEAAELSSTGR